MNINTKCPKCGGELTIDERWIGRSVDCPYCNKAFVFSNNAPSAAPQQKKSPVKQYKVLTQKDKWFSGKFDPEKLEGAINAYAKQGWRFAGCATASMPGLFNGKREEMVIIMERG